jgi:hypothetical protein
MLIDHQAVDKKQPGTVWRLDKAAGVFDNCRETHRSFDRAIPGPLDQESRVNAVSMPETPTLLLRHLRWPSGPTRERDREHRKREGSDSSGH